jgi:hypothetical protein
MVRRMASPLPRLPSGLTPVAAGRLGLWLLGKRQHTAAEKRTAFPARRIFDDTYVRRFERLITPWRIYEYCGSERFLAAILGICRGYAHNLLKPGARLPSRHARKLADYLAIHASQCEVLAAELRSYAAAEDSRKFANKGIARKRRLPI